MTCKYCGSKMKSSLHLKSIELYVCRCGATAIRTARVPSAQWLAPPVERRSVPDPEVELEPIG